MAEIIRFSNFEEFVSYNEKVVNDNPLLYFFLIENIKIAFRGKAPVYMFFNITNEENNFLVALQIDNVCLIYADGVTEETIQLLSDELEFHKFKRYNFAGTKQVIDALFKLNNAVYKLTKHRVIYKCYQVSPHFSYSPGKMQMGDINRLDELAGYSVAFAKDFDGQVKDRNHMKTVVHSGISKDNFYQWSYNNNICSIAQAMHDEYDFPVIGHLYTNPLFRNQGFAASIVHRLTKGLLDAGNEFCMLTADGTNPISNKIFQKVGYISTGEYLRAYKEQ